jgi:chloride channel 7
MIHSGAIIGGGLPQGKMSSVKLELDFFKYFRNDEDKRLFVACGSAAGVSAAFGAPIGGMLFNIEEGASDLNLPSITQYMISSLISLSVLNFGRRLLSGGTVVEGGLFAFGTFEDGHWDVMCLGVFALMGVFGGLTGSYKIS